MSAMRNQILETNSRVDTGFALAGIRDYEKNTFLDVLRCPPYYSSQV